MSKSKPNGFMCFVMEYKNKTGKKGLNINDAIREAGPVWEKMCAQQRGPYNEMAKRQKKSNKAHEKMDCHGRPLTQLNLESEDAEQRERAMKMNIENVVKNSVKKGQIADQHYYFMAVNYFTKNRDGVYVPAELAVTRYSLKDGIDINPYHSLINPDIDIFGHQYEAQNHAAETHMLPVPPKAMGNRNLGQLYNDVLEFVRDKSTGELPPIYTAREFMPQVKSCLEFLQNDHAAGEETLEVYSIHYLFFVLKEATCKLGEQEKPNSIYVTDAFFERDFFDYEVGISCNFHEEKDRTKYCALSYATRWGYMFSDYMCRDIAILPVPGRHLPAKVALKYTTVEPPKASQNTNIIGFKNFTNNKSMPDAKWEQRWENETIASESSMSAADFPALGTTKPSKLAKAKMSTSTASVRNANTSVMLNDEEDDIIDHANNPWTARSRRNKPVEPDSSVFEIDFSMNKTLMTSMSHDDMASSSVGRTQGRGTPVRVPNSESGRGRGRIYQN